MVLLGFLCQICAFFSSFIDSRKRLLTAGRDSYRQQSSHFLLTITHFFSQKNKLFLLISPLSRIYTTGQLFYNHHYLPSRIVWRLKSCLIFLDCSTRTLVPSVILMFGETLSRFEVSTLVRTLFNHRAGFTPQDTIVSIITLVIILCFESIRCLLLFHSQQSPNLLLGGGSSGRWKVSNDSVKYFTCYDTDESKLEFNLIGK